MESALTGHLLLCTLQTNTAAMTVTRLLDLGVHKRQAVYELFIVTPAIGKLIAADAEADRLHQVAIAEGMTPITQAAFRLVREGNISLYCA